MAASFAHSGRLVVLRLSEMNGNLHGALGPQSVGPWLHISGFVNRVVSPSHNITGVLHLLSGTAASLKHVPNNCGCNVHMVRRFCNTLAANWQL